MVPMASGKDEAKMTINFHSQANKATYTGRAASDEWRRCISELAEIRDRTVADIGCGGGIYARALVELGAAYVFAVDFSTVMLEAAREHCTGIEAISFHHGTADATGLDDKLCDLVLERALIHHVNAYAQNFSEIRRILRPGGVFIVQDRTMEDVLQPPSAEHIRGYFFEAFPRLRETEMARRPDGKKVRQALETSGFCRVRTRSLWETRQVYANMTALGEDILRRQGRSILHALTDDELHRLVHYLQERMPEGPLVEKDRWTLWVAERPAE
jgi:ubiquinone/menaquinone biosynthesis C-methylase UbiE